MPFAIRLQNVEVMMVLTNHHFGEKGAVRVSLCLELPAFIVCFITKIKFIVVVEITHDILRSIRPKHLRHATFAPALVYFGVAAAA